MLLFARLGGPFQVLSCLGQKLSLPVHPNWERGRVWRRIDLDTISGEMPLCRSSMLHKLIPAQESAEGIQDILDYMYSHAVGRCYKKG